MALGQGLIHRDYWSSFYGSRASAVVPMDPTNFGQWVHGQMPAEDAIVEFGFGNARDSIWFAQQGREVIGFDFAETAVDQATWRTGTKDELHAEFFPLNLYSTADVIAADAQIYSLYATPHMYGRFLIHSLEDEGRLNLFDLAAHALPDRGGYLFLEFRTGQDAGQEHVFGEDHFRKYLDPEQVVAELEERDAVIKHVEAGHGLAVYKTEDPHVARVAAWWAAR